VPEANPFDILHYIKLTGLAMTDDIIMSNTLLKFQ